MAVYTFWEGHKPAYIDLCMRTWKVPYTVLNYDNLHEYTDLPIDRIKRFTLPQIADIVRVHVLRDQGGYWLDADTIMVTGNLPETDMVGYPEERANTIGFLYSEKGSRMFAEWAAYQDSIIDAPGASRYWALMGNSFTDKYVRDHEEVRIHPVADYWPETYMIREGIPRYEKYWRFYFAKEYRLSDIHPTDMLMLHNSWTPKWYKDLFEGDVLNTSCTLSNVLKELV